MVLVAAGKILDRDLGKRVVAPEVPLAEELGGARAEKGRNRRRGELGHVRDAGIERDCEPRAGEQPPELRETQLSRIGAMAPFRIDRMDQLVFVRAGRPDRLNASCDQDLRDGAPLKRLPESQRGPGAHVQHAIRNAWHLERLKPGRQPIARPVAEVGGLFVPAAGQPHEDVRKGLGLGGQVDQLVDRAVPPSRPAAGKADNPLRPDGARSNRMAVVSRQDCELATGSGRERREGIGIAFRVRQHRHPVGTGAEQVRIRRVAGNEQFGMGMTLPQCRQQRGKHERVAEQQLMKDEDLFRRNRAR